MASKNETLHGQAPDTAPAALLVIDMINDLEFVDADLIFPHALAAARAIAALKRRCRQHGIPTVYVNDNFGRWQSDMGKLVQHCLEDDVRGRPIVELLRPEDDDYVVLKPKQSGFFATTLDTLLQYLQARALIVTGIAGDMCVQFTVGNAYMRDFDLFIPRDCVASNTAERNEAALGYMRQVLRAWVGPSASLDLAGLVRGEAGESDTANA